MGLGLVDLLLASVCLCLRISDPTFSPSCCRPEDALQIGAPQALHVFEIRRSQGYVIPTQSKLECPHVS